MEVTVCTEHTVLFKAFMHYLSHQNHTMTLRFPFVFQRYMHAVGGKGDKNVSTLQTASFFDDDRFVFWWVSTLPTSITVAVCMSLILAKQRVTDAFLDARFSVLVEVCTRIIKLCNDKYKGVIMLSSFFSFSSRTRSVFGSLRFKSCRCWQWWWCPWSSQS